MTQLNRRRFLCISAAFAAAPAGAQAETWAGRAFGAEVAITLRGPRAQTAPALHKARDLIAQIERHFSIYDETSELSRLNAAGWARPSPMLHAVLRQADAAYRATGGLFDPTVQPLWQALQWGGDTAKARAAIGWHRVRFDADRIELGKGQALTFNGIAQGYATDQVSDLLRRSGFAETLVNIGEFRGRGGPWRIGVVDPAYGLMATRTLTNGAIATSSPMATPLGQGGHILHANASPRWSSVSVEAQNAAWADALSTGLVLAEMDLIRRVRALDDVQRITLVDASSDLITL